MIKVVNLVSLLVAPMLVLYADIGFWKWVVVLVLLGVTGWAFMQSKKPAPKLKAASETGD